jgi:hypothetical protein
MTFDGIEMIVSAKHRLRVMMVIIITMISLWLSSLEQKEIPVVMASGFCRMEIPLKCNVEAVEGSEFSVKSFTSIYPQNKMLQPKRT